MTAPAAPLDEPRPVRAGEELDAPALEAWLAASVPGAAPPIEIAQFPGGHSNLTYLVRAGGRELVLRRPPFGSKVKTAHDMEREYRILSRLFAVYPKAPRALAHCTDLRVIGAPFYVAERATGVVLRGSRLPRGLAVDAATMRRVSQALVDGLVELHEVDPVAAGLADLGHPEGYVERQVRGWTERYRAARTDDIPELERAAAWLVERLPAGEPGRSGARPAALVHNDYKYDNLVLDPSELATIRAVLDWEMATVGDPLLDLGTSLAYWIDPDDAEDHRQLPLGPTLVPGNLGRREVVARYAARSGRPIAEEDVLFAYVYGLFKVAVIAQQIYYRFAQGLTKDERFALMILAVAVIGRTAARAIEVGRIDRLG